MKPGSTEETMVAGTEFLINPISTAITPIFAAIIDIITVFSATCKIIGIVKFLPTRCIKFSVIPNVKKTIKLLINIEMIVNPHTIKIFFLLTGYEKK